MIWPKAIRKTAMGIGVLSVPAVFAMTGAGQASADPGLCVSGPYGYASACVEVPGVQVWYDRPQAWRDGPGWHNGRGHGHGKGHGHGDWDD